jgi:hypothetical protein
VKKLCDENLPGNSAGIAENFYLNKPDWNNKSQPATMTNKIKPKSLLSK